MTETVLDIDVGNTRIKWRLSGPGQEVEHGAMAHQSGDLSGIASPGRIPRRVRIASVVGTSRLDPLLQWSRETWQVEPEIARVAETCGGVVQAYEDKTRLGVDRWLALLAAYNETRGPVVVVSCGTAVTVDLVTARGVHLGGYIVPGLGLMRRALFEGTEAVKVEGVPETADLVPGHNTPDAVNRGLLLMLKGLVEQAGQQLVAGMDSSPSSGQPAAPYTLMVTGGDGQRLAAHLSPAPVYNPHLVLDGLAFALP